MLLPTAPFRKLQPEKRRGCSRRCLEPFGFRARNWLRSACLIADWTPRPGCFFSGKPQPPAGDPMPSGRMARGAPTRISRAGDRFRSARSVQQSSTGKLGPSEPELSRGNIAIQARHMPRGGKHLERLRDACGLAFPSLSHCHTAAAVRIFNLCRALSDRVDFGLVAIREAGEAIAYDKLHEVLRDVWIVDLDKPESTIGTGRLASSSPLQ